MEKTKIDMTKIDWVGRKSMLESWILIASEDEDIHTRQIRGNVNFIDMKLPRAARFEYIKKELKPWLYI